MPRFSVPSLIRVVDIAGLTALALALAAAWPAQAQTRTFTCGQTFAQLGDSKAEVAMKCGQPIATDSFCRRPAEVADVFPPPVRRRTAGCDPVDEWTYRPPSGQFITRMRFENGALASIQYGDRVP